LAKQMIADGKIGEVRHFNAVYYQDWLTDPNFPMVWRHDVKVSGSGAHGDMNAHIVDLARYLVDEFTEVNGVQKTFIKERPLADGSGKGNVTADDATSFLASFRNGALGMFNATRLAPGRKNFLRLEIFGSTGSISFNLEKLNELEYYSENDEESSRGYRTILVTEASHPYIDAWWPPGHIIGWEHTFIHVVKELYDAINGKKNDIPTFYDGLRCQQVLDAVVDSANSGKWIKISEGFN
jgi:predicted dehydrogenase